MRKLNRNRQGLLYRKKGAVPLYVKQPYISMYSETGRMPGNYRAFLILILYILPRAGPGKDKGIQNKMRAHLPAVNEAFQTFHVL